MRSSSRNELHELLRTHTHIGLDIDETLADTLEGFLHYAHRSGKLQHILSKDQILRHDVTGLQTDMTPEECNLLWEWYGQETLHASSIPLTEWCSEGVRKLYERGKELSIITARSDQDAWKKSRTENWIKTHFPFITEERIHYVNHFSDERRPKSDACEAIGVTLMIDDAMENAINLAENGISCILLEKPWNHLPHEHPLIYRVSGWSDIIAALRDHVS